MLNITQLCLEEYGTQCQQINGNEGRLRTGSMGACSQRKLTTGAATTRTTATTTNAPALLATANFISVKNFCCKQAK